MSMASRLTIEHASAGKVTSNCTFNIKTTKNQLLHEANKSNHITDLFGLTYFSLSTSISTCQTVWKNLQKQLMACSLIVFTLFP